MIFLYCKAQKFPFVLFLFMNKCGYGSVDSVRVVVVMWEFGGKEERTK